MNIYNENENRQYITETQHKQTKAEGLTQI